MIKRECRDNIDMERRLRDGDEFDRFERMYGLTIENRGSLEEFLENSSKKISSEIEKISVR